MEARVKERMEERVDERVDKRVEERERMKTTMPTIIFPVPTHVELSSGECWETELDPPAGVNKKLKKIKTVWHGFGNLKTVWQGESGALKTVYCFFKYCLLDLKTWFCVANCLILLLVEKIEAYSNHIFSFIKLCVNKDNLLVPLLCATPISVCQMRKSLKLSVRIEF